MLITTRRSIIWQGWEENQWRWSSLRVSGPWRQNVFKNCNFIRKTTQPQLQSNLNSDGEYLYCGADSYDWSDQPVSRCTETDINSQQAGAVLSQETVGTLSTRCSCWPSSSMWCSQVTRQAPVDDNKHVDCNHKVTHHFLYRGKKRDGGGEKSKPVEREKSDQQAKSWLPSSQAASTSTLILQQLRGPASLKLRGSSGSQLQCSGPGPELWSPHHPSSELWCSILHCGLWSWRNWPSQKGN